MGPNTGLCPGAAPVGTHQHGGYDRLMAKESAGGAEKWAAEGGRGLQGGFSLSVAFLLICYLACLFCVFVTTPRARPPRFRIVLWVTAIFLKHMRREVEMHEADTAKVR